MAQTIVYDIHFQILKTSSGIHEAVISRVKQCVLAIPETIKGSARSLMRKLLVRNSSMRLG